jgi:sarcosine reductase
VLPQGRAGQHVYNRGLFMRLEIESVNIKEIQSGSKTYAEGGILFVNLADLEELILKDARIQSVDISMVHPGDRVRIVNLIDIVQPRCKIEPVGADFPGLIGKMQLAGWGRTRSLEGMTVLVSNPNPDDQLWKGVLDASGMLSELSRFGSMRHVHISPHKVEGTERLEFEKAVKLAGLKTAVYLARLAESHQADEVKVYDLDIPNIPKNKDLPRVAYYFQVYTPQFDKGGMPDQLYYGTDVINMLPNIIHPNEVLDGGFVGPHTRKAGNTYSFQNHAMIKELYGRHGKDLIFAGMVFGVANLEPVARTRKAMVASNLIKNVLGADGVVLTKIHGGMPHVDVALVAEECEKLGVRTAVFTQPVINYGTLADTLLFDSNKLDLVITVGATLERMQVPLEADRILGGNEDTKIPHGDGIDQRAGDPVINLEEFLAPGVHDMFGGANVIVKEY